MQMKKYGVYYFSESEFFSVLRTFYFPLYISLAAPTNAVYFKKK